MKNNVRDIKVPKSKQDIANMFAKFTKQQLCDFGDFCLDEGLHLETSELYYAEFLKRSLASLGANVIHLDLS